MIPEKIPRFLIVGLGNPGAEYAVNRHNVGWLFLDALVDSFFKGKKEFAPLSGMAAEVVEGRWAGKHLIFLKPLTYMNLSGGAVSKAIVRFSVPPEGVLIVYDDVDLPFGRFRIRVKGSAGGHNGMASIIDRLSTSQIKRIRLGVGPQPGVERRRGDLADFVLSDFTQEECKDLGGVFDTCEKAFKMLIRAGITQAMNRFNIKPKPEVIEENAGDSPSHSNSSIVDSGGTTLQE